MIDLLRTHALWEADVARPLIARPTSPQLSQRLATGKLLDDRMRTDSDQLTKLFAAEADAETRQAQSLLAHAAEFTAALMLLFGAAAILADYVRSRTIVALERERTIADTLQRVFLSGWEHAPDLEIGTAYVSASLDAALGGDLFDVHSIDEHRTLLLVADISGKGIFAAVETALVKFSIRILVEDDPDPGSVLQKFNATYLKSADDPTSFVSVFVGILDHRTHTLRYANAGHGPVYVRRAGMVEQLQVTGPLVGVRQDATFAAAATSIGAHDTIVLATDGLTEARDSSGMMLEDDRAMRWIADGQQAPQPLADEIVNRISKYAGGRITDDLALLVVRWSNEAVPLEGTQVATAAPVSAPLPNGPPAMGEPVMQRSP
jgi:serine phosphatase RsbU (regulator of sigma subunit)